MSLREGTSRELGKGFALFAAAFALFAGVIAILSEVGLPRTAAAILFTVVVLSSVVAIGFATRTMHLPDFQVASRRIPAALNGMATAAAFLASAGFLGVAGAFFGGSRTVVAVIVGWVIGFLALAVLVAPYLRKAGAVTVADFLAIRFGSATVRLAAFIITLACSAALLVAEIATAGEIATMLLPIGTSTAIAIVVVVVVCSALLGGMNAVTMTAIAQYIVLAIAFITPVTILSLQQFDFPLPQLSYGYALKEAIDLGGPIPIDGANRFLMLPSMDSLNMLVLAVCLAAGVASLPHIVTRSVTAAGVGVARRSAGWALFFVLIVLATAPAYGAFAQLALLSNTLPGSFDASFVVLALPDIADLSPAVSALVAIGALAAVLAAATALLFAIANTVGHDFYGGIVDRNGPSARQLIVTRATLIVLAGLAGWYAADANDHIFTLAATSASLAASGLFPALVLGIWWKRATAFGALAGIVFGFAAAAAYVAMIVYGGAAPWPPLGDGGPGLPPIAAAFFGLPVGFLVIVVVSLITPAPKAERMEILDAIRRPTPSRLFDT